MKNDAIIKSILTLLKEYKAKNDPPTNSRKDSNKASLKYLINQAIREYDIPKHHRHASRGAQERWEELSSGDIMSKHYQDKVVCDRLKGKSKRYDLFVGASKERKPKVITEKDSDSGRCSMKTMSSPLQ